MILVILAFAYRGHITQSPESPASDFKSQATGCDVSGAGSGLEQEDWEARGRVVPWNAWEKCSDLFFQAGHILALGPIPGRWFIWEACQIGRRLLLSWSRLIGKLSLCGDYLHQANVVQRNSAFLKSQVFENTLPPPRRDLLHFPPGSESLTLPNLQISSPPFSLVVGADNRGFILKRPRSPLSLLLTSLISIRPLPQKFVRLDHLLRCSLVQASDQHLPIALAGATSFYFDSIWLIWIMQSKLLDYWL